MKKLTPQEVYERMKEWRNMKKMYESARKKNQWQAEEIKRLKVANEMIEEQAEIIEFLKLRIEELEKMVFKKRKRKKKNEDNDDKDSGDPDDSGNGKDENQKKRTKESYRRPKPNPEEITETNEYKLSCCPDCAGPLSELKTVIRYVEDMILPTELLNVLKRVEEQFIQTGYCQGCQKRVSAEPIQKHDVTLGENVKQFVVYATVILRLTYEQVRTILNDLVRLNISDGEIANILTDHARQLLPEFHELNIRIRGAPGAHFDETSWKVQKEEQGNHGWVKTATDSTDTVFLLGRSRGKGNAIELKGEDSEQIGISDDYAAYDNIFEKHALCWAHPERKFSDLAKSKTLSLKKHKRAERTYAQFSELYADLEKILEEPFDLKIRKQWKKVFMPRFKRIMKHHPDDPRKLKTIKKTLLNDREKYFICLLHHGIPADNNKAERALRHLVIKRKISFGSKTQKGADVMSILYSTILSLWWKRPPYFFQAYSALLSR